MVWEEVPIIELTPDVGSLWNPCCGGVIRRGLSSLAVRQKRINSTDQQCQNSIGHAKVAFANYFLESGAALSLIGGRAVSHLY